MEKKKYWLIALLIIVFLFGMYLGYFSHKYNGKDDEVCMDSSTFSDRQKTLIYCDYYLGNCKNKADIWFEENPNWTQYNFSLENASWFGGGFD